MKNRAKTALLGMLATFGGATAAVAAQPAEQPAPQQHQQMMSGDKMANGQMMSGGMMGNGQMMNMMMMNDPKMRQQMTDMMASCSKMMKSMGDGMGAQKK